MDEQQVRQIIREELRTLLYSDRYIFSKNISILEGRDIQLGTATGTKFGTTTGNKLAFFNSTPVIQQSTAGTTAGFTANTGTTVNDASTFTGNVGSTAYRLSDIVNHLKTYGLMAS